MSEITWDEATIREWLNLGACCACERTGPDVRNVICINKRSPIPGRGWGCFVCGLSQDGAIYVLCDNCLEHEVEPCFACRGHPGKDGRVPIEELAGEFKHDLALHEPDGNRANG